MHHELVRFVTFHELSWKMAGILGGMALGGYFFSQLILSHVVRKILFRHKKDWHDIFITHRPLAPLAYVIPLLVLHVGLENVKHLPPFFLAFLRAGMGLSVAILCRRLIMAFHDIYKLYPMSKKRPITGYVQLVLLLVYCISGVVIICALLDKSPLAFLSGLGAVTALLMLVFRDTILSFIAGIQIAGNNLLETGDWVELPSEGANGEVLDIALNVIKIQNFDKSMVVLPTYKILEKGFKSWRSMENYGRRRVKRGFFIDQKTIKEFDEEELKSLRANPLVSKYLPEECAETNNMGLFRAYSAGYLAQHSKVFQDYTPIIRFLSPTEVGLPLEYIFFILDTRWRIFEEIQADIMQHLTAALHHFGLEVGQDISD